MWILLGFGLGFVIVRGSGSGSGSWSVGGVENRRWSVVGIAAC